MQEILRKYPGIALPSAVSNVCVYLCVYDCDVLTQIEQDMCEILQSECINLKEGFFRNWQNYVVAIPMYTEANKKIKFRNELNPSGKEVTYNYHYLIPVFFCSSDVYSRDATAFKVLCELFKCNLSYIFDEIQVYYIIITLSKSLKCVNCVS